MADPRQMADFDPSDLSQRPEGWRQWKARADWLRDQAGEMREAMQEFVNRCERGEVRSKYTYAKFKNILTGRCGEHQPHDTGNGGPASEEE